MVGTDLYQADLRKVQLKGARLSGTMLCGANLREADLASAALHGTNFSLSSTTSEGSMFSGIPTDLRDANLSNATIILSNFSNAILDGADLSNASLLGVIFADVDLNLVKGLDTVTHQGPSTIGIETVYRSQGKIPEVFLKEAGVPDSFIENMRSLVGKPIDYYSCFISYSSKDQAFAERLHADLQSKGVRCWFALKDIKIGDKFRSRIDEAVRMYDKLLLVLSEHSIKSPWVEKEVEGAFEKERKRKKLMLFPIQLDETVRKTRQAWAADIRRTRHIGDFRQWKDHDEYQKAFTRLLNDLQSTP